jgi:menaquinone-9 beta-reductase
MIRTNICIIGAGPAGATTALYLAKMGVPHLIVDAAKFPRDKVCGDGLDLKVMRVLQDLNPDMVADLEADSTFTRAWGAKMIAPNGRAVEYRWAPEGKQSPDPQWPLYRVARRADFDHWLVRHFNAQYTDYQEDTKVKSMARRPDGYWQIEAVRAGQPLQIEAKLVIGADGDHSTVLRSLGQRGIDRRYYGAAQRQYWQGVEGLHADGLIEFYFPPQLPWAYFWIFPLPNGAANVGLIMLSEPLAQHKVNLREALQQIIQHDPVIAPRFKNAQPEESPVGWGLPMSSLERPAAGDGYLLVGDAASLISPVTGEGIGTSMFSGCVAAYFARKAVHLNKYDASVFTNYQREVYRLMWPEIRLAHVFRRMYGLPWGLLAWALNRVLPAWATKWAFRRMASGWLDTALRKPIRVVELDPISTSKKM